MNLVTRQCGYCLRTFRCLPESNQSWCSHACLKHNNPEKAKEILNPTIWIEKRIRKIEKIDSGIIEMDSEEFDEDP